MLASIASIDPLSAGLNATDALAAPLVPRYRVNGRIIAG